MYFCFLFVEQGTYMKVLNGTKLINESRDPLIIQNQFGIIQNLQTSPIP